MVNKISNTNNLVSIIMNCFNSEKFIRKAIESVLSQNYQNWELIIWDNLSEDNTKKIIDQFNDDRILYFCSGKHLMLGAARNEALKKSSGKYITFLDSDDIWLANKLDLQVKFVKENPTYKFIYSNYYVINEKGNRVFKLNFGKKPSGNILSNVLRNNSPALLTIFFESSFIKLEKNLFDNSLELVEEFEFFTRILCEYKAAYLNIPLAEYRVHSSMNSKLKYSNYPKEIEYVIKKLRNKFKNSNFRINSAIDFLEYKNIYYKAHLCMKNKKRKIASRLLFNIKYKSIIFLLLYILSLFPHQLWNKFHRIINRY